MKNDGRCANCGRVPVAGSTLCVDCLAACEIGRKHRSEEIEGLKLRISRQQKLIREIFEAFQELLKAAGR